MESEGCMFRSVLTMLFGAMLCVPLGSPANPLVGVEGSACGSAVRVRVHGVSGDQAITELARRFAFQWQAMAPLPGEVSVNAHGSLEEVIGAIAGHSNLIVARRSQTGCESQVVSNVWILGASQAQEYSAPYSPLRVNETEAFHDPYREELEQELAARQFGGQDKPDRSSMTPAEKAEFRKQQRAARKDDK